ncbi:MAG: ribose 5-phosphate isomerase B [Bdellovibrionaceae bacterium]|nr:ribose 5-phosphate isomerase B [Pseudobdellovibrionaceae bacterium]|tara:strand:+ start:5227 stop:5661 length:435 start_codon:yes stop_codon:yes gene_type:complete
MQKLFIASDHAGFDLKEKIKSYFLNIEWIDLGTKSADSVDYPDLADALAKELSEDGSDRAILICGSGQGMAIRANKYPHIRAALCYNNEITELSRLHNDANVLCLGSRFCELDAATQMVKIFLNTDFEGGRHQRRVDKLSKAVN